MSKSNGKRRNTFNNSASKRPRYDPSYVPDDSIDLNERVKQLETYCIGVGTAVVDVKDRLDRLENIVAGMYKDLYKNCIKIVNLGCRMPGKGKSIRESVMAELLKFLNFIIEPENATSSTAETENSTSSKPDTGAVVLSNQQSVVQVAVEPSSESVIPKIEITAKDIIDCNVMQGKKVEEKEVIRQLKVNLSPLIINMIFKNISRVKDYQRSNAVTGNIFVEKILDFKTLDREKDAKHCLHFIRAFLKVKKECFPNVTVETVTQAKQQIKLNGLKKNVKDALIHFGYTHEDLVKFSEFVTGSSSPKSAVEIKKYIMETKSVEFKDFLF